MTKFDPGKTGPSDKMAGKLRAVISEMGSVLVACSGGVDSTFLLNFCLKTLGHDTVWAVVVNHPLLKEDEAIEAANLARKLGASVFTIDLDPRHIEEVAGNAPTRCYHCKKFIFSHLRKIAEENNIHWLLDGTNADDDSGYRPGIQALEEMGVRSPLREAGLTKETIRKLSRSDGLPTWDKPSAPCLATRFPYDHSITDADLERVKEGESILESEGFEDYRLRVHGNIARIEVPARMVVEMTMDGRRQRLVAALKSLGYGYVTVDLEGLRSGSMDEAIVGDDPHRGAKNRTRNKEES